MPEKTIISFTNSMIWITYDESLVWENETQPGGFKIYQKFDNRPNTIELAMFRHLENLHRFAVAIDEYCQQYKKSNLDKHLPDLRKINLEL